MTHARSRHVSLALVSVAVFAVGLGLATTGCSSDKAAAKGAEAPKGAAVTAQAPASTVPKAAPTAAGPGVASPGLHVSEEIARLCSLPQTQVAPSFDFDSSSIVQQDKDLLQAIAKCLSDGALKGRNVSLIGRADARGEAEYNMSLGGTRADSVRRFLKDMGVEDTRVGSTSRGELDATGADEAGYAHDRRVDIELAN